MVSKSSSRIVNIALAGIFGGAYAALTILFAPISYLNIQIRIAEVMIAFIPLYGWPVVIGLTLGTFIGNLISPLGIFDLLIGPLATFLGCLPLLFLGRKRNTIVLGFLGYAVIVSGIIAGELSVLLALPFFITFVSILLGEVISAGLGGTIIYSAINQRNLPYSKQNTQENP